VLEIVTPKYSTESLYGMVTPFTITSGRTQEWRLFMYLDMPIIIAMVFFELSESPFSDVQFATFEISMLIIRIASAKFLGSTCK